MKKDLDEVMEQLIKDLRQANKNLDKLLEKAKKDAKGQP